MSFALPATAEGLSVVADVNGEEIVFAAGTEPGPVLGDVQRRSASRRQ
jgi:hypothetical protein